MRSHQSILSMCVRARARVRMREPVLTHTHTHTHEVDKRSETVLGHYGNEYL